MNHSRRDETWLAFNRPFKDQVNSPAHYSEGRRFEVIEILEDWSERAPNVIQGALLWQVLKYLGRLFDKDDPLQDAQKARWYLDRLISKMQARQEGGGFDPKQDFTIQWSPSASDYLEDWHD